MAIDKRLLTVEGLQDVYSESEQVVDEIESRFKQLNNNNSLFWSVTKRLYEYIKATKQQEQYIMNVFGVNNEKELQDKFENFYKNSGLINFTGLNLESEILELYSNYKDDKTRILLDKIQTILIPETVDRMTELGISEGQKAMVAALNELGGLRGKKRVRSSKAFRINDKGEISIILKELTEKETKILKELKIPNNGIHNSFSSTINGFSIQNNFDWNEATGGGLKPSDVKGDSKRISDTNKKITQYILNQIDPKYHSFAKQVISIMIKSDPTLFFVGDNTNKITGILGEINAMITINSLLPNVSISKITNWVASTKIDNKELSTDIYFGDMIKNMTGIQVKNSSKDLDNLTELKIDFVEQNLDTVLKKLQNSYDINFSKLGTLLTSKAFNVPYRKRGRYYEETSLNFVYRKNSEYYQKFDEFKRVYVNILSLIDKINFIFTAYAPDFLYMSGGEKFENQLANLDIALNRSGILTGNNLYLIGRKPIFMSSMLTEIINDLRKIDLGYKTNSHFVLEYSLGNINIQKGKKTESVSANIVAYKNNQLNDKQLETRNTKMKSGYIFSI